MIDERDKNFNYDQSDVGTKRSVDVDVWRRVGVKVF